MKTSDNNEVKEKRKYFLNNSAKVTKIFKGDKRVNGTRMCAVCGTRLSNVILANSTTQAIRDHFHCFFSELFYVNICLDSRNCTKVLEKGAVHK